MSNVTPFKDKLNIYNYLYCCTVHFEDSLNISHQQMHQLYIIY